MSSVRWVLKQHQWIVLIKCLHRYKFTRAVLPAKRGATVAATSGSLNSDGRSGALLSLTVISRFAFTLQRVGSRTERVHIGISMISISWAQTDGQSVLSNLRVPPNDFDRVIVVDHLLYLPCHLVFPLFKLVRPLQLAVARVSIHTSK